VDFSGARDLLGKLFTLAQAAANDYEGFEQRTKTEEG
jgi:hypothetical protein